MDKFLEIVYTNQLADSDKGDMYEKFFKPLLERIQNLVSESIYRELEDLFMDCITENNCFYAVEGMKMAIGIMEGTFISTV